MTSADELAHLVLQSAQAQMGAIKLATFGHISDYDPKTNAVRCILPSFRDATITGTFANAGVPQMTPWIPLASFWVGNGFGFQFVPHTGATVTHPTDGEQCLVLIIERATGLSICACLFYTNVQVPPGLNTALNPGEALFIHESGSFLKFASSGDVYLTMASGKNLHLQSSGGGQVLINSG